MINYGNYRQSNNDFQSNNINENVFCTHNKVQPVSLCLNWLSFMHTQIIIMPLLTKHPYFQLYSLLCIFSYLLAFPSGFWKTVFCSIFLRHLRIYSPLTDRLTSLQGVSCVWRTAVWRAARRNRQRKGAFQTPPFKTSCSRVTPLSLVI